MFGRRHCKIMPSKVSTPKSDMTMEELLASSEAKAGLTAGDIVEGTVIAAEKHEIWVDLGAYGTGLVIGREIEQTQDINPGDVISTSVLDPESDEGHVVLSLK